MKYLALLALAGCTAVSDPVVICPVHLKPWTSAQQYQIFVAQAALPDNSILLPALEDYATMRDEARACR